LAVPGAFQSFLLLDKYSAFLSWMRGTLKDDLLVTSAPDKFLFLSVTMAITGIVTVLKWDRVLPDGQDYLNLAPLPLAPRRILAANALAIAIAVVVFAIDVNLASSLLFPLFVTAANMKAGVADYLQFAAIHAATLTLASVFTFCAVFGVLGAFATKASSSWWRGLLLVGLIAMLFAGFAGPAVLRTLSRSPDSALRWLPPVWFVGLYQTLQHRGTPLMSALARTALTWSAGSFVAMLAVYGFSYRRRFAEVLESARRPGDRRSTVAVLAFLDSFAAKAGFARAAFRFVVRAVVRNEAHRMCIAVALGLGWLLASQQASTAPAQSPLIAAYLLILGLRLAFELPAAVSANWIFRVTLDLRQNTSLGVARRVMLAFLAPTVLAPSLILTWWVAGAAAAVLRTLLTLALSLCLMEALLSGYRRIPLTSPMPGFRDNLPMLCLLLFLGFELFTRAGATLDAWIAVQPLRFLLVPAAMAGAWFWRQSRLRDAEEAGETAIGLTFESAPPPTVERLNLD
jgi:hypothetical protein